MTPRKLQLAVFAVLSVGAAQGASAAAPKSTVVQWNQAFLEAIAATSSSPTVGTRALAIAHTCMFDAWAAYDDTARGTGFDGGLRRPARERNLHNKRAAVSHAAYRAGLNLFPGEKARFDRTLKRMGLKPDLYNLDISRPAGVANVACGEVIASRFNDGANQYGENGGAPYSDFRGYRPVNTETRIVDPNHWQPLRLPSKDGKSTYVQQFLTPHWGWVRPFAAGSFASYHLAPPPRYGTPQFAAEAQDIIDKTANLTEKQKAIAEFWADNPGTVTPPGHWNLFAEYVAGRDRIGLDGGVKLFFALNNGLMDAAIVGWRSKVETDYVRPITAIRMLMSGKAVKTWRYGGGTQTIAGQDWAPYQPVWAVTPPFAECVSGHSTFSATAAEVLRSFTGNDRFGYAETVRAGTSKVEPGIAPVRDVTLSWPTFTAAADEAGISRRHGGIHFPTGDLEGRRIGRTIGRQAWEKAQTYFGADGRRAAHHGHGERQGRGHAYGHGRHG